MVEPVEYMDGSDIGCERKKSKLIMSSQSYSLQDRKRRT